LPRSSASAADALASRLLASAWRAAPRACALAASAE